jgi:hypothetical protein
MAEITDTKCAGLSINGTTIPWSFVRKVWKKCGKDWDQTIDCFWKARKATGNAGIQKYIAAGFKSRDGKVPYMLQPSKEREVPGGMKNIREWWHGLYFRKTAPVPKAVVPVSKRDDPSSMAEIFKNVFGGFVP